MDARERFRLRNRIDAELQQYAEHSVDVSDIDALPIPVAYAAFRDGILVSGGEKEAETYRKRVEQAYETTEDERARERREFIDRLAKGDV